MTVTATESVNENILNYNPSLQGIAGGGGNSRSLDGLAATLMKFISGKETTETK